MNIGAPPQPTGAPGIIGLPDFGQITASLPPGSGNARSCRLDL